MTHEISDARFEALLREMLAEAGDALCREDALWRDQVPESVKRAARDAVAAIPTAPALRAGPRLPLGRRVLLGAVLSLSAAGMATAGAYHASPTLRAWVDSRIAAPSAQAERMPGDYAIPAPWDEYEVTDAAQSETVNYAWFVRGSEQVLVEIALRLPDGVGDLPDGAPVSVGGLEGLYSEQKNALLLCDRGAYIFIKYWNGGMEDVLTYAEALLAANP